MSIRSQNLIPNHDFSQLLSCTYTNAVGLENYYANWFSPPRSPSDSIYGLASRAFIWDTCNKQMNGIVGIYGHNIIYTAGSQRCPLFKFYNPYPKEGTGYLGMTILDSFQYTEPICYTRSICSSPWQAHINRQKSFYAGRNFAEVMITQNLITNEKYIIEFYVLRGYREASNVIAQNAGALISSDTIRHFDYKKQSLVPTVEAQSLIFEEENWVRIKGEFTAIGNEKFLTLGNFRTDANSNYLFTPADSNFCAGGGSPIYYFDAVYLYLHTDTLFNVELPPDTTLCPGQTLQLHAWHDDGFKLEDTVKTFLWSNGSTDSSITVTQPGFYWVKVEYNHRFWQSDTIEVKRAVPPYTSGLKPLLEGCQGDEVILKAQSDPNRQLLWSTGYVGQSITVRDSGYYWLSALSVCDTVIDSVLVSLIDCDTVKELPPVYIPSAFTPNGDGLNDTWAIGNLPEENELVIFNRWGELIYRKVNYQNEWDGRNTDGSKLPLGVYIYQLTYSHNNGKTVTDQGWVSVLDN